MFVNLLPKVNLFLPLNCSLITHFKISSCPSYLRANSMTFWFGESRTGWNGSLWIGQKIMDAGCLQLGRRTDSGRLLVSSRQASFHLQCTSCRSGCVVCSKERRGPMWSVYSLNPQCSLAGSQDYALGEEQRVNFLCCVIAIVPNSEWWCAIFVKSSLRTASLVL